MGMAGRRRVGASLFLLFIRVSVVELLAVLLWDDLKPYKKAIFRNDRNINIKSKV
jgi:hypothetical protein